MNAEASSVPQSTEVPRSLAISSPGQWQPEVDVYGRTQSWYFTLNSSCPDALFWVSKKYLGSRGRNCTCWVVGVETQCAGMRVIAQTQWVFLQTARLHVTWPMMTRKYGPCFCAEHAEFSRCAFYVFAPILNLPKFANKSHRVDSPFMGLEVDGVSTSRNTSAKSARGFQPQVMHKDQPKRQKWVKIEEDSTQSLSVGVFTLWPQLWTCSWARSWSFQFVSPNWQFFREEGVSDIAHSPMGRTNEHSLRTLRWDGSSCSLILVVDARRQFLVEAIVHIEVSTVVIPQSARLKIKTVQQCQQCVRCSGDRVVRTQNKMKFGAVASGWDVQFRGLGPYRTKVLQCRE